MTVYQNFEDALNAFKKNGGAMDFFEGWDLWEVTDYANKKKMVSGQYTVKECTKDALKAGGLKKEEIDKLMEDFKD